MSAEPVKQIASLYAASVYARLIERALFRLGRNPADLPGSMLRWEPTWRESP